MVTVKGIFTPILQIGGPQELSPDMDTWASVYDRSLTRGLCGYKETVDTVLGVYELGWENQGNQ